LIQAADTDRACSGGLSELEMINYDLKFFFWTCQAERTASSLLAGKQRQALPWRRGFARGFISRGFTEQSF